MEKDAKKTIKHEYTKEEWKEILKHSQENKYAFEETSGYIPPLDAESYLELVRVLKEQGKFDTDVE